MNKKIKVFLILFLLLDTCYTFYQHYYLPHDGDMAPISVPGSWYADVLEDPFGIGILTEGKRYAGSNRFFAHWSLGTYLRNTPLALQAFTNPLDSSYLATSFARTGTHLFLLWLLATFISGTGKFWRSDFLLAAALIVPLFQMGGQFYRMSVIGDSVTYTFFYALSLATVLLFFLPFYRAYILKQGFKLNFIQHLLQVGLMLVIPFQGPLNLGVTSIAAPGILALCWWYNFKKDNLNGFISRSINAISNIPKPILFYFSVLFLLSLYSFYIGTFNTENDTISTVSLPDRYPLLLWGLNQQLFFGHNMDYGPAYTILLLTILVNTILLWKHGGETGRKVVHLLKWIGIIAVFYILLLPFGGYRTYRPYIIETGTFMPVTLAIFFAFGFTCWHVLKHLTFNKKKFYTSVMVLVAIIFSTAEKPDSVMYDCEREGIKKLAASKKKFVNLDTWCGVMSWGSVTNPFISETYGKLLHHWGILNEDKTYITRKE